MSAEVVGASTQGEGTRRRSTNDFEKNKGGAAAPSAQADADDQVTVQLSSRAETVAKILSGGKQPQAKDQGRCTPNVKALALSSFLFALITVVQVFAAKISHSQALLMDCISMGVDALTYMGNIVVECKKADGGEHEVSQLIVVAISLGCLIYFTIDAARESFETVQLCRSAGPMEGGDDVNGYITLGFALGGVVFDLACLAAFYSSNKKTGSGRHVNMFSALLHVAADFLRSSSTLIMSMLILCTSFDSTCMDAYTSLFIGATILLGAMAGVFRWLKLLAKQLSG